MTNSTLVQCRLALLLQYYLPFIFNDNPKKIESFISFLFNGLHCEKTNKAFALQCAIALTKLLKYKALFNSSMVISFIKSVISSLDSIEAFKVVNVVIEKYGEIIDREVVVKIVKRVEDEVKLDKKITMVVIQCLHLLKQICDLHIEDIDIAVLPLFDYIKTPKKIEFEDEILTIMQVLIEEKKVSDVYFPYVVNLYNTHRTLSSVQTNVIIYYIIFKKPMITEDLLMKLINISFESISKENPKNGSAIIQCLLQTYTNINLPPIIENSLKLLKTKLISNIIYEHIIQILMSTICNNPSLASSTLMSLDKLEDIINVIIRELKGNNNYMKLLCLGMTTLLRLNPCPICIRKKFSNSMEELVVALDSIMSAERSRMKKNKRVVYGDESDTEDSEVEGDVMEYKLPVRDIDEFQYFRNAIKELIVREKDFVKSVVDNMEKKNQLKFQRILNGKRVKIYKNEECISEVRRIVKAKRIIVRQSNG